MTARRPRRGASALLAPVVPERIERSILLVRGHEFLLDADLADLYGVETKALTPAVRRNVERFPADFMFRLTRGEFDNVRRPTGT